MSDHDISINEISPEAPKRPAVVKWHIAYCVFEVVMDLAVIAGGIAILIAVAPDMKNEQEAIVVYALGIGMIGGGLFGAALYGFGALVPRRPWGWIVGLILIMLGLSSCTVVVCIPLIIYWFKPETKSWYGMKN